MSTNVYDKIADEYKSVDGTISRRYIDDPTFFNIFKKAYSTIRGDSFLDLACGNGYLTRKISDIVHSSVIGVDISERMISQARDEEKIDNKGIDYHIHDAIKLPKIGEFDIITAGYLLHYSRTEQELNQMCKNIYKNLKKNGRFITLNRSPERKAYDKNLNGKYGVTFKFDEPLKNGEPIEITLLNGDNSCSFINYFWDKTTYDKAFKKAGFRKVEWHNTQVSKEGIEKFGKRFWKDYLKETPIVCIECYK